MRWLMPTERFFLNLDVPKLQYIPILLDEDGSYPVEANTYLVERSCGEWAPRSNDLDDPPVPTLKSRRNMASRLCAFWHWVAQDPDRDWRALSYQEDILERFQVGLLTGTASASRRPLKASTINLYVDEACGFLGWAAERGFRAPFKEARRRIRLSASRGAHSHSHRGKEVSQRHGTLQVVETSLDGLPVSSEVARWMKEIQLRHPVKALVFEFIVRTGARISEANQLRVGCVPRKEDGNWKPAWFQQGWMPVTLRYGVKGGKVAPASLLSTRSRVVQVPIDLANRIDDYLKISRPTLLSRYHRGSKAREPRTDRLWLGEHKQQPVSNQMLYAAWVGATHCPKGWHPHAARHYFSIEAVCESTRQLLRFHEIENPQGVTLGWLHGLMAGQVRLILSPLLGHVSEETSMRYLRCAQQRMLREFGHPALDWNALIDADLESGDE